MGPRCAPSPKFSDIDVPTPTPNSPANSESEVDSSAGMESHPSSSASTTIIHQSMRQSYTHSAYNHTANIQTACACNHHAVSTHTVSIHATSHHTIRIQPTHNCNTQRHAPCRRSSHSRSCRFGKPSNTSVTHITISERTITMHVTLSQEQSRAPCFFTSLNTQSIWSSRTCGIRVRHRQSTMSNNYLALVPPVAAPLDQPEPTPLLCPHALQPLLLSDASDATRNAGRKPQADF